MTLQDEWNAALARLDVSTRNSVLWRYRHRGGYRGVGFAALPPAMQRQWIDYARKRARPHPRGAGASHE